MQRVTFDNICEGMNVCDRNGEKIGTISKLHRLGRAVGGPQVSGEEGYVQVMASLPGLGKELYIPLSAFRDCTTDICYLIADKDEIGRRNWGEKPSNI